MVYPQKERSEADHWMDANARIAEVLVRSVNDFDLEALARGLR